MFGWDDSLHALFVDDHKGKSCIKGLLLGVLQNPSMTKENTLNNIFVMEAVIKRQVHTMNMLGSYVTSIDKNVVFQTQ